jgi:hypothetical protein
MPKSCKLASNLLRRIIAIALLAIAGCATPYQPEKGFGLLKLEGGFFEQNVRKAEWFIPPNQKHNCDCQLLTLPSESNRNN